MFKCDQCGACCQNLQNNELYSSLHNGNGICYFFNKETKMCDIYNVRPIICRVDDMYDMFYKNKMTKKQYYQLNNSACKIMSMDLEQRVKEKNICQYHS